MLALQLHGRRKDPMVQSTADWIMAQPISRPGDHTRVYYGYYFTSHAMAQAGGKYWDNYFPRLVRRLLPFQDPDGSWRAGPRYRAADHPPSEETLGRPYNTAIAILALTLPDQLLPIHQR